MKSNLLITILLTAALVTVSIQFASLQNENKTLKDRLELNGAKTSAKGKHHDGTTGATIHNHEAKADSIATDSIRPTVKPVVKRTYPKYTVPSYEVVGSRTSSGESQPSSLPESSSPSTETPSSVPAVSTEN